MTQSRGFSWSRQNLVFSALFAVFACAAGGHALLAMRTGTPSAMGPGFFPIALSILLGILSVGVAFLPQNPQAAPLTTAPLRAIILILACPLLFGFAVGPFGLVIAVFVTVLVSCFASRITTPAQALILSVLFTGFCVLVFHYLLNMTIPLWGEVFTG